MIDEQCAIDLQIESDSQSAIQLLQGIELPKRSRHIEVRVEWLKAKLADGSLRIRYRSGETNVADLFTKCLGTKTFLKHRTVLGFAIPDQPVGELNCLADDSWISAVMATPLWPVVVSPYDWCSPLFFHDPTPVALSAR